MTQRINSVDDVSKDIAKTIESRGGLYEESIIKDKFYKHLFNSAVEHFAHLTQVTTGLYYKESGRRLKFGIINTTRIGAFASIGEEDIDFVGIHFGTISLVSAMFTRMMSNPNILPTVGDSGSEIHGGYIHFIPLQEDLANFSPCRPACSIRSTFSKFLVLTGLDFIFGHEVTHITRGHLGLLKKIRYSDPDGQRREFSLLENQGIELDADCGAAQMTLEYSDYIRSLRHMLPVKSSNSLGIAWREFYADEFKTIEYCFFASYLTLRMTSPPCWDIGSQQGVRQPLMPYRMGTLMQVYVIALMQNNRLSFENARANVFNWCFKAEQAHVDLLAESGKGELQISAIESFFNGIGDYNEKVFEAKETLENELSEFEMKELDYAKSLSGGSNRSDGR